MEENDKIQLYENQPIRTAWDKENEEWFFSIIDVISVLTESKDANAYWRKLKQRLFEDENETVTNCHGLKIKDADGKRKFARQREYIGTCFKHVGRGYDNGTY